MRTVHRLGLPLLALLTLSLHPAIAQEEPGLAAVRVLGTLNGTALHCRYLNEVRLIKQAMITSAPKTAIYGRIFHEATDAGFKAMVREGRACPGEAAFAGQVGDAIGAVREAFSRPLP